MRSGEEAVAKVPDWRYNAKGANHWLGEAADVERKLERLVSAAASVERHGPEAARLAAEIERNVAGYQQIEDAVRAEMAMLRAWIDSQTTGLMGRIAGGSYRAQF